MDCWWNVFTSLYNAPCIGKGERTTNMEKKVRNKKTK